MLIIKTNQRTLKIYILTIGTILSINRIMHFTLFSFNPPVPPFLIPPLTELSNKPTTFAVCGSRIAKNNDTKYYTNNTIYYNII